MARTKGRATRLRPRSGFNEILQMEEFEQKMRKYYPKKSRFFYNNSHYQPNCADDFQNPNSLVPQRYKRDFFRSFYADLTAETPEPSKIPQNLQVLKIFTGSEIVLRKLIKQNKRLKSIVFETRDNRLNRRVIKTLKYSKSLRSIMFKDELPYFSERECQKMSKTFGKILETFQSLKFVSSEYHNNSESFKRVMETILKFPKLKMFQFENAGNKYPFDKLQERNIAYSANFLISAFNSLIQKFPQFKPTGNFEIGHSYCKSDKMYLETRKFQKKSNQTLTLDFENRFYGPDDSILLIPVFQNISSLSLTVSEYRWKCSSLGQLTNLRHLSVEICDEGISNIFGHLFSYLNQNVAPHNKLETFLIKTDFHEKKETEEDKEEEQKEQKSDAILHFFEACSQSLRTVHFEFQYHTQESQDPEFFYQGLNRLECIQSLNLLLSFHMLESKEHVGRLCKVISEMKSLSELDFKLLAWNHGEKQLNIKLPPQLKKLSIGMDTSLAPFNTSKTLGPLTNLSHLELVFADFSLLKWGKILGDIIDKIKGLEVLVLKKTQEVENKDGISQMKEKLDKLMKESSNLKLIIFANMSFKDIIILKRNYSWSEINLIIKDLSFQKTDMKVSYIKSYA